MSQEDRDGTHSFLLLRSSMYDSSSYDEMKRRRRQKETFTLIM